MSDPIERLYEAVMARKGSPAGSSRTAKLLATGTPKIAQKLGEEAIEVAIDAATGNRDGVVLESVDLLYNLAVRIAQLGAQRHGGLLIEPETVAESELIFGVHRDHAHRPAENVGRRQRLDPIEVAHRRVKLRQ